MLDVSVRPPQRQPVLRGVWFQVNPRHSEARQGRCPEAVWRPRGPRAGTTSKPLIPRSLGLQAAHSSDWHPDMKPAFCSSLVSVRYWDAVLEHCCIVMGGWNWPYLWKLVKPTASRKIHVSFVLWVFILMFSNTPHFKVFPGLAKTLQWSSHWWCNFGKLREQCVAKSFKNSNWQSGAKPCEQSVWIKLWIISSKIRRWTLSWFKINHLCLHPEFQLLVFVLVLLSGLILILAVLDGSKIFPLRVHDGREIGSERESDEHFWPV